MLAKLPKLTNKFIIMGIVLIILYWVYTFLRAKPPTEGFESAGGSIGALATKAASLLTTFPSNPVSPRIDNENSFLGMVKFCKEHAAANIKNPFDNAQFNENCGMCVTSGTIADGTEFDTHTGDPAGVLVYQADKQQFWKEKSDNGYPYTRAIPSLESATCMGATKGNDSTASLALNADEYRIFYARTRCLRGTYGNGCGMCLGTKKMAWVDLSGAFKTSTMALWGFGSAKVSVAGAPVGSTKTLSMTTAAEYDLGIVNEGDLIQIEINAPTTATDVPYVYGAVYATNPDGSTYRFSIDDFLEKDLETGLFPRTGLAKTFRVSGADLSCDQLKPKPKKKVLKVQGPFPLTFVDSDQLAAMDCPSSPLTLSAESTGIFTTTDPCLNPARQGPDDYTDNCLRKTLSDGGCSTAGTWYGELDTMRDDYTAKTVAYIRSDFTTKNSNYVGQTPTKTKTEYLKSPDAYKNYMMSCYGRDTTTPCDKFIGGGTPDQACMSYLYTNQSAQSDVIGPAYTGTPYMQNPAGTQMAFCQAAGSLNPANPSGLAALQAIAASYSSYTGLEAVKAYLTDVFAKATGNLTQNVPDAKGGRYDSWGKCIGTPIQVATVPSAPSISSTPSNGSISVSWTANSGGVPITNYNINGVDVGTQTSKVFSGLNNGTTYTYTVTATNVMGTSAAGSINAVPNIPAGTYMGNQCCNPNMCSIVANGYGGTQNGGVSESNVPSCGYVAPTPPTPPTPPPPPTVNTSSSFPPRGTFIENNCCGTNICKIEADGNGGRQNGVMIQGNVPECGYVDPNVCYYRRTGVECSGPSYSQCPTGSRCNYVRRNGSQVSNGFCVTAPRSDCIDNEFP